MPIQPSSGHPDPYNFSYVSHADPYSTSGANLELIRILIWDLNSRDSHWVFE